ncbi:hypothetical protein NKG94_13815 [Micromonospora sp. M12]
MTGMFGLTSLPRRAASAPPSCASATRTPWWRSPPTPGRRCDRAVARVPVFSAWVTEPEEPSEAEATGY